MTAGAGWDAAGRRVLVTGLAADGFAAAVALAERGADVLVLDGPEPTGGGVAPDRPRPGSAPAPSPADRRDRLAILDAMDVRVVPASDGAALAGGPGGPSPDLVVTGGAPLADRELVAQARGRGVEVLGDVELAWRLRPAGTDWLLVGGTRRRRAVARLCADVLRTGGIPAAAAGWPQRPALEAVADTDAHRLLVVDVSPWQASLTTSVSPLASLCLSMAAADLDLHGDLATMRDDAGAVYRDTVLACLYAADDARTEDAVRAVDVVEGCRAVAVGLGVPAVSSLGLVEDVLCDRAFVAERRSSAAELATLDDVRTAFGGLLGPELVRIVLGAAGLARAVGAPASAVRDTLRAGPRPPEAPERLDDAAQRRWVLDAGACGMDDAEGAVSTGGGDVVWVASSAAGRVGEGVETALRRIRPLLRGVVLADDGSRGRLAGELARHAAEVPVVTVPLTDTGGGSAWADRVVEAAVGLSEPGDCVVWAPGVDDAGAAERFRAAVAALRDRDRPGGRGRE